MNVNSFFEISQCPNCKSSKLKLNDSGRFVCSNCSSIFATRNNTPNLIPTSSTEYDDIRRSSYDYWDGGIPGTVNGGYQEGKVSSDIKTKEWFLEGDVVRYDQYKNIPRFAEFNKYKGKQVLDIGPGRGQDSHNYIIAGANVFILEYAGQGVDLVQERIDLFDLNATLIQGDAVSLPFQNDSFDLVYSYGVLHHIPDIESAISEVLRVLKPGGEAKIMVYHKGYFYYKDMFIKWFILKANFMKYSWSEYIKVAMEQRLGPCPVVYIYTMDEIYALFNKFDICSYFNAEVVTGRMIRWGIIPKFIQGIFMNSLGAFCHLTLKKPR